MEKEFVPYEESLALKNLGFNELCSHEYNLCDDDEIILEYHEDGITNTYLEVLTDEINDENIENEDIKLIDPSFTAPLYQQAFRWFREKYNYWSYIFPYIHKKDWNYHIQYYDTEMWGAADIDSGFKTYEEAELECLKKLIEIVKNER